MCGVVDGGITAGSWGYEAGQSGVGDIFGWYVKHARPRPTRSASPRGVDRRGRRAAGRRARPGRAGLVERQPVAAGRPRPQRGHRRADPGHPAAGHLPGAAGVHRVRHPHDHRGVREAGRPGRRAGRGRRAHQQRAADADLRRRDPAPAEPHRLGPGPGPRLGDPRGGRGRRATPTCRAAAAAMGRVEPRRSTCPTRSAPTPTTRSTPSTARCTTTSAAAATTCCTGCGPSATPRGAAVGAGTPTGWR